jgi:ATP-dependent RNA helicase DeaD
MARAEEKQRPIASIAPVEEPRSRKDTRRNGKRSSKPTRRNGKRSPASQEAGMVRLSLSTGKADGVRVNHVVGTLAHFADIPGNAIGRIDIEEQHTYVDVPEQFVRQVLAKTKNYKIGRQSVTVARA